MPSIQLTTALPGPKSQAMQQRRRDHVTAALGQTVPLTVQSALGSLIHDVDGNTVIDLMGGIGVLAVGHNHPAVVQAITEQAQQAVNPGMLVVNHDNYAQVAELLNRHAPGDFRKKTILANGGAEAVENAVKIARYYTGRAGVVVFEGAYHGRTNLTMAMTSKYGLFKKNMGPFAPEVYRLHVPNMYRVPTGMTPEQYLQWSCDQLDFALTAYIDGSAIAAFVIEPVLGEGGIVPIPARFLEKVREVCDRVGAVMIADEIQSGSGRTGKLFAIEHSGVVPDLITVAKSLGAGLPISAVVGRAEIMDAPHLGAVGSTYGGGPLACAAAVASLNLLTDPAFLAGAERIEATVRRVFEDVQKDVPALGDIRGIGAMMAIEFVKDDAKTPWPELVMEIVGRSFRRGVIVMRAGLFTNAVRFLPALNIPQDQLEEALDIVADVVREVYREQTAQPVTA
ncbi:aminotransferase class III-fold pyridoxal phosphate-dependent enzyme (plasmid) [Deinococcus sp. KNUC1210]|uniref:aspartate aminotransferase family protein n=1 Tax=Deinococcus sp. KNUC1210 TaxID=2917691 RepID=UPI001EF10BCC|nr:aminotransferase class III-fold pyridoxal phosphate-dependent enzyme [Deinococcus sp. KNUC1210]ULH14078.1 aminotransferase class III-fold pyridoxal phosphate-dependent enzyme [Deinococcus sp. KNUC1210]